MNRHVGKTLVIAATLLLISCGIVGSSPASTVKNFYKAVEAGDITKAKEFLSSTLTFQMGKKLDSALGEQTRKIKEMGGIKSIDVEREDITGEVAEVVLKVTYGNGNVRSDRSKLQKEKGAWKIQASK
jgi:major membrane immunogen (membrane-anchored lipoprotein)